MMLGGIAWQGYNLRLSQSRQLQQEAKLQQEHDRGNNIILSAPVAIIMCNRERNITVFNEAAEQLFGWPAKEMLGQPVDRLVTANYLANHARTFGAATDRLDAAPEDWQLTRHKLTGMAVHHDGHEFGIEIAIRGIKYGGQVEFIATCTPTEEVPMQSFAPRAQR